MPDTTLELEIDGNQIDATGLAAIVDLQIEEAADVADALTLVAEVKPGGDGSWTSVLDALATPRTKVRATLRRDKGVVQFSGLSVEAEWSISSTKTSTITVKAIDRSVEMDAEEKVVAWRGTSDSSIASAIFAQYGIRPHVKDTPRGYDPDVHVVIQRATDWAFLRSLAERWGYAVYLEVKGLLVTGCFQPIDPLAQPQAEVSLGHGGQGTNVKVVARLTAGHRVKGQRIPPLGDSATKTDAAGGEKAQGADSLGAQATVLLSPSDIDGEIDLAQSAVAVADKSALAATLTAEIDVVGGVPLLHARRPVLVKGLGTLLSGQYDVQRVRHKLTRSRHRQDVTLQRNALGLKGDEPFGNVGGGLLGGIGGLA